MTSAALPPSGPALELVVHARREAAAGIVALDLRRADGGELPPFEAGAHVDVQPAGGPMRQYSLCNDPAERHRYVLGVLRDPASRGGSIGMHGLRQGDRVQVGLPRNAFGLDGTRSRKLLVAGGIGITPIKAMMHRLAADGIDFELHYFARSEGAAAFTEELLAQPFAGKVHLHFDDRGGGLPLPAASMAPERAGHVYVCGPSGFIDRVCADAQGRGFSPDRIHVERFAAAEPAAAGSGSFVVQAVRSDVTVEVGPDETIVRALERAGLQVLTSCEQGLCGVCLTPVLEGIPDHRDDFQTDEEKACNDKMTICCSRAKTAVLKLDV